jgi:hypothetical protein
MLSACSASMVQVPAPAAAAMGESGNGVMCYSDDGLPPVVRARHADAYQQMARVCDGAYHVVSTDEQDDGALVVASANMESVYPQRVTYVTFACVPK